jgi:sarcosine oxidase subunit gamma
MIEPTDRRHGLESLIEQSSGADATESGIDIRIRHDLGHINLRGPADDKRFAAAIETCLGQGLPVEPNTLTNGKHQACWLGPDEWLILTEAGNASSLVSELEAALGGIPSAVNDVGGGQVALQLVGDAVRDVFAKGCTLDFHAQVFTTGLCAQSGLAKASVLFTLPDDSAGFYVVVRRSFADYLLRWLHDAASEFGVRTTAT